MKVVICRVVFDTPAEAQAQKAATVWGPSLVSCREQLCAGALLAASLGVVAKLYSWLLVPFLFKALGTLPLHHLEQSPWMNVSSGGSLGTFIGNS